MSNRLMLPCVLLLGFLVSAAKGAPAAPYSVSSPDGRTVVEVKTDGALRYAVTRDGAPLLNDSRLGFEFKDAVALGANMAVTGHQQQAINESWENRFGKNRRVTARGNELRLALCEQAAPGRSFDLILRAYNDGVAFRYILPRQPDLNAFVVARELTEFALAGNYPVWAGEQPGGFHGAQEWEFLRHDVAHFTPASIVGLPLLVHADKTWLAISEAELTDWAGMWLGGTKGNTLSAKLAPRLDGNGLVKAATPHASPWRVLLIGDTAGALVESDLILNLSSPCTLQDTTWIKPGMMAWDNWWSGGVKMDMATEKKFIQLAADMGWPYQLVDWQWYGKFNTPEADVTKAAPQMNIPELVAFAKERNVRLWLWMYWTDIDRQLDAALPVFEKWGLAGIKIDFMDRDDQEIVNWYSKVVQKAAEHHLMVVFHGAFKPTGLNRTYPNQITREGVRGNEYHNFSTGSTPEHTATLPFTRMLAGPMDYTPGGFLNRHVEQFRKGQPTCVIGTRAHELALFVIYDSPLCCACDAPERYRGQPGAEFLKVVPTVWDQTKVLAGEPGQFIITARQSGNRWFIGAITDTHARKFDIPLAFLGRGKWHTQIFHDTPPSNQDAEQIGIEQCTLSATNSLPIGMARDGGFVAVLEREKSFFSW